jgi:hypothetical protein
MTRRGLIRRLLLVFAFRSSAPWRTTGRPEVEAAQPVAQTGEARAPTLSASELDDLVAFGEVVVGSGPLSPAERGFLIDHIQYRVPRADGHYLSAYRTTVGLLRQLTGGRFASLDLEKRHALVTRHRLGSPLVWPDEKLGPFPDATRTARTQVVGDLIGGYYGSPAGWAVVGYDAHPGQCSDLVRYTGPGR